MKRPAQSSLQKQNVMNSASILRALKQLTDNNDVLWWPLWVSYCNLVRNYGFSPFRAYETMYNEWNFATNFGEVISIEQIKAQYENMTPEGIIRTV